jgi:hypothetical protein
MNSLTAVLAWDYLRRNYLLLLACFLVALCSIVLSSSSVAGPAYDQFPTLRTTLYSSVMFNLIAIVMIGVLISHFQIHRLYLKPISSFAIVAHHYWLGASLVALLIAIVIGAWKWFYFLPDWPILQPILYALICWGIVYPWTATKAYTPGTVLIGPMLQCACGNWLMSGSALVAPKEPASGLFLRLELMPSAANLSVTAAILVTGFLLSIWRFTRDRSDQSSARTRKVVGDMWQRWAIERKVSSHPFVSKRHAYQDSDFRSRTYGLPLAIVGLLFCYFGVIAVSFLGSDEPREMFKLFQTWIGFFALMQMVAAGVIAARLPILRFMLSFGSNPGIENNEVHQYRKYFADTHFISLPISDQDIVDGKLRSSFVAVGYAFVAIVAFVLGIWIFDRPYEAEFTYPVTTGYSHASSLGVAIASAGGAFMILNTQGVVATFLMHPYRWSLPFAPLLLVFSNEIPVAYLFGIALLLLLFVIAYTFTEFTDGDRERLSKAGRLIPGTCGGSFALLTIAGYADAFSFDQVAVVLFSLAVALTLMAMTALATELTISNFRRS